MNIKRERKRKKEPTFKLKELYTGWDIRRAADICKLTALQRTVIERIADCAQREHCLTSMEQAIYPGYEDLARRIGSVRGEENISSRSLSRAVSRLSALGYLMVIASPRGNRFFIAKSIFLRAYLQTHPTDKAIRNQLADELRKVREANRKNPKRFGGRKGRELKKVHSHMEDLAKAVKEGGDGEKSKLAELGNVVNIFCKTRSKKMREINFLYRSDLPTTTGRTCQQRQVRPASRGSSTEPTLSGTTESRTHVYIPTSKSIDSVENTAGVKVGMDVFVKHDVFGRYARVFRQQPAGKAEIESFYAEYLNLPEANFSAILRRLEIFETVPPMQTSHCARGYSHLKRLLSDVESVAAAKRTGLGVDYKFWDKVPSRVVVAKIALDKGWSPELTHQWLLEKPADESFLNLVKSIAAERAEAKQVVEDERARKQAEHEAMEARLSGESEEYRQLAARLQEQNSYRVFPGCDWVKDFITKATLAQLNAAVEDGGRFEDKKEIPGDRAEQTGDASGAGPAEPSAKVDEENQPAPGAITPASEEPADFGWEPEYDDESPTAGELNAVFCDEAEGGTPEEQTEAPETSGDTQAPPVTPTTTEAAPMGSEAEAPGSVEPPTTIAQEEKGMAEVSEQGKSSADEFQERIAALLNRAEGKTGKARQKIWDQAMALRKERDEARKQAKTGAPPPALPSEKQEPDTTSGVGEQSATQAKKVQQFSVNDPRGFDMPEFVSSPPPEEMGRGQRIIPSNGGQATRVSDDVLDDFIFGDSGESALESGVWLDKKGVPSPETTRTTHGTGDGTVADDISNEQEVQPHAADSSHSAEIPEDLNSSPSGNQDGEQRDVQPEQSSTTFDAQLDEFILAGLGETEPEAGGLSGSGSEKAEESHEFRFEADSTTGSTEVENQRPDASVGSGLNGTCESKSEFSDSTTQPVESGSDPEKHKPDASAGSGPQELISVASDFTTATSESGSAPLPSGVCETSRGARAVLHEDLSGYPQKMPARTESGPKKQRPEAKEDSGPAVYSKVNFTSADSNISESAGQGWGYTGEGNQRPEAQVESGLIEIQQLDKKESAENTCSANEKLHRSKNTAVNNKEPEVTQDSGSIRIFQGDITTPVSTEDSGFSPEQAISLALGTAGPPAEQKKSVAGRKNIPALQRTDPASERSVSAGKKKISGNVAVRDSGKRELTPPSTESTDGGPANLPLRGENSTADDLDKRIKMLASMVAQNAGKAARMYAMSAGMSREKKLEYIRLLESQLSQIKTTAA